MPDRIPVSYTHLETSQIRTLQNKSQPSHLTESLYPDSVWYSTKAMAPESMWRRFRDRLKMMKEIVGDDRLTASTVTSSGFFNYVCSSAVRDGLDIKADLLDTSTKVDKRVAGRVPSEYKYKKYIEEFGSNTVSYTHLPFSYKLPGAAAALAGNCFESRFDKYFWRIPARHIDYTYTQHPF